MKNLDQLFQSFENGMKSAVKPKQYLKEIGLDSDTLRIGYNSAQFHHGKPQELKEHYEGIGVLNKNGVAIKQGETAYTVFGSRGLIFPLVDKENTTVNYFAYRFELSTPKEEYLNTEGIYPSYPSPDTSKLYIAPTVLDCASLLASGALGKNEAVMALENGKFLPQHKEAIQSLTALKEIIIINR